MISSDYYRASSATSKSAAGIETATSLHPFPDVIDSTMRAAFVACPRQWYYAHLLNLRRSSSSIHLHFGKCVAKGLEVTRRSYWQHQMSALNALGAGCNALIREWGDFEPPESTSRTTSVKTLEAAIDALVSYFEHFSLGSDSIRPLMIAGEPCIEKSFALPIPGIINPSTGAPLVYAGRFDLLATFNDAIFVEDDKTTTALGSTWRSNWALRGQLSSYCWGSRTFGVQAAGCIIRGIGVMAKTITFEEVIVSRPPWHVDMWLRQLQRDCRRMIAMWQAMPTETPHDAFDQALDGACTSYGGCSYTDLCTSPDPTVWYDDYEISQWHPLGHDL